MKKLILIILFLWAINHGNLLFSWEPEEMNMLFRQGESLYEQGKYREAIGAFQKVIKKYPDNTFAKDYIKKAEEKIRLAPGLLKKETKQEIRLDRQEVKLARIKAKQDMLHNKHELYMAKVQKKHEVRLSRQRQKEELIRQKIELLGQQEEAIKKAGQAHLDRMKAKVELREKRQQLKLAQILGKFEAKERKLESLVKSRQEKEARIKTEKEEKKDRTMKAKAKKEKKQKVIPQSPKAIPTN